ncbi:MAG: ribbon-helix-helix protein, CopG family [Pelolinea sp.]|nr:ribbon-helix-helix protein, CopG family [Pelolinea sp.]
MLVKEKKQRVNIMLDETQRVFLDKMAEERRTSVSEIIRELIEEVKKKNQALKLAMAAETLAEEYRQNEELTAFTALDSEEIA